MVFLYGFKMLRILECLELIVRRGRKQSDMDAITSLKEIFVFE